MGYESRVYIVKKSGLYSRADDGSRKCWAEKISMFNMCKAGDFPSVFKKETTCYIYDDGGDAQVLKDCYDKPLTEASVDDVIQWLETEGEKEDYWRFTVLLETLMAIKKSYNGRSIENIAVLHYGY